MAKWGLMAAVLAYTIAVLIIDTLATAQVQLGIDWGIFRWHFKCGFDLFKFVAWFLIPLACSIPWIDWEYFGVTRWKRMDAILLVSLAGLGLVAVLAIPLFPFLKSYYHGIGEGRASYKWWFVRYTMLWNCSWLIGWEFLHRYFLLRPLAARWPRYGWLIVPLLEGAYHLSKPTWLLEAPGMAIMSLIITGWAVRRKNVLLPFLAHLIVELELLLFLLVT